MQGATERREGVRDALQGQHKQAHKRERHHARFALGAEHTARKPDGSGGAGGAEGGVDLRAPVPAAPGGDPDASTVRGAGLWLDGAQSSHVAGGSYAPQFAQAGEVWAVCESGDTSVVFVGETLKDG